MTEIHDPDEKSAAAKGKIDAFVWASRITNALTSSGLGAATDVAVTVISSGVTAVPLEEATKTLQQVGEALNGSTPIILAGRRLVSHQPALQYVVRIPGGHLLGRLDAASKAASKSLGPVAEAVGIVQAFAQQLAADADREDLSDARRVSRAFARAGIQN